MLSAPFQELLDLRPWLPFGKLWFAVLLVLVGLAWAWRYAGYGRFLRFSFVCGLGTFVGLVIFELWWQSLHHAVGNDFDRRWLCDHDGGGPLAAGLLHLFLCGSGWFIGMLILIFKHKSPEPPKEKSS